MLGIMVPRVKANRAKTLSSQQVTIKDVADAAGVSVGTVSKAMRGSDRVGKETRERISTIAANLGWRVNHVARGLVLRRSYLLGLVASSITNNFCAQIYEGADSYAVERGYGLLLCVTEDDYKKEKQVLERLRHNARADGVIIIPAPAPVRRSPLYDAAFSGWPHVFVSRHLPDLASDRVLCDDVEGGAMVTRHLLDLGHTKIAYVYDSYQATCSHVVARRQGYEHALAQAGIKRDEGNCLAVNFGDDAKVRDALLSMLRRVQPTALFAHNDRIAAKALDVVRRARIQVPEQLSIVGFGNLNISELVTPQLTTVDYSAREMGRLAARILIERLEQQPAGFHQMSMQPRLIRRESDAKLGKLPHLA